MPHRQREAGFSFLCTTEFHASDLQGRIWMSKANDAASKAQRRIAEAAAARTKEMGPSITTPPSTKPLDKKKGRKQSRGK
jgi:hypothetical protein